MKWKEEDQNEYADGWKELTGLEERTVALTNAALAWSTNAPNELHTKEKSHTLSCFEASFLYSSTLALKLFTSSLRNRSTTE